MTRSKPWLKMWVEWIGDPKMDNLSLAEQGAWWRLVSLAHQCADDGALTVGGTPLSTEEIMKTLKITDEVDRQVFLQMSEKMKTRGSLHWDSNTLIVTHYKDRQTMVPSNLPDAVLSRQHKHRQKEPPSKEKEPKRTPLPKDRGIYTEGEEERHGDVTTEMSRNTRDSDFVAKKGQEVTKKRAIPFDKNRNISEETEGKTEEENVTIRDTSRNTRDSDVIAELSKLYEEYIDVITPHAADQLREFAERYKGDIEWIRKAFDSAGNKRRWPYIAAILERYQDEGGPDGRAGQELERQQRRGEDERRGIHEADKRDTLTPTKRHNWKVKRSGPAPAPGGEDKR